MSLNIGEIIYNKWKCERYLFMVYELSYVDESTFKEIQIDLDDFYIFAFKGDFQYLPMTSLKINEIHNLLFEGGDNQIAVAPKKHWIFCIAPLLGDSKDPTLETIARQTIEKGMSLSSLYFNIYCMDLFCLNIVNIKTSHYTTESNVIENPSFLLPPFVAEEKAHIIERVYRNIAKKDEYARNRIVSSLKWYLRSKQNKNTSEIFVLLWIAIETLCLEETTKITPILEVLSEHYKISQDDAREKYSLGLLCSVRGRIVHDGVILPLDPFIPRYLKEIYKELVLISSGMDSDPYAEQYENFVIKRVDKTVKDLILPFVKKPRAKHIDKNRL